VRETEEERKALIVIKERAIKKFGVFIKIQFVSPFMLSKKYVVLISIKTSNYSLDLRGHSREKIFSRIDAL